MNELTIEQFLEYVDNLMAAVKEQLERESDPESRDTLLRLDVLLKSGAIRSLLENLAKHKVDIPAFRKVQEMDNALDELFVRKQNLPYPYETIALEQRKNANARQITLLILILGLSGFEWVL